MTNREKLAAELHTLDDRRLGDLLEHINITTDQYYPTDVMCGDCKARSGGRCPYDPGDGDIPDDCECPTMTDWLGWECRREKIIREVGA